MAHLANKSVTFTGLAGKLVDVKVYTTLRSVLCGAGLAYALNEEEYLHLPVIIVFPSVYAGYQCYKNRETLTRIAISNGLTIQLASPIKDKIESQTTSQELK
jgi:hypothetical protein